MCMSSLGAFESLSLSLERGVEYDNELELKRAQRRHKHIIRTAGKYAQKRYQLNLS